MASKTESTLNSVIVEIAKRSPWSQEEGSTVLRAWRESGLSLGRFARAYEIGASRLRWWKNGRQQAAAVHGVGVIHEVNPAAGGMIEVQLPNGVTVRSADPTAVASVLMSLTRRETALSAEG